jgi:hypothetical protein
METSWYQSAKLFLVSALGLSKDALHVHVGLGVGLLARVRMRRSSPSNESQRLLIVERGHD